MMNANSHENTASEIRRLNDQLRTTFVGGAILITPGVEALTLSQRAALLALIRGLEAFPPEDDPYGEHDFGAVDFDGSKFFFKIDYYDLTMDAGSPNPANPNCTRRVMTIMRADEY